MFPLKVISSSRLETLLLHLQQYSYGHSKEPLNPYEAGDLLDAINELLYTLTKLRRAVLGEWGKSQSWEGEL